MDIKIDNNDIKLKPNSEAVRLYGIEQALQQAELAIKIPNGSFVYDRSIGAFEDGFDFTEENDESKIESRINECLLHTNCQVDVLYISSRSSNTVVGIEVDDGKSKLFTEVIVDG